MAKRLYRNNYMFNEAGKELNKKTHEAFLQLFYEYLEDGYSIIEISHVFHRAIYNAERVAIAEAWHPESDEEQP